VPQAGAKIEKAGSRQLRRFELRLCFDPALLYRHKLQLQSSQTALQAIGHVGSLIQQNLLNAHTARRRLVAARATLFAGWPIEPGHLAHVGRPPLGLRLNRGFRLRR
jgi:hypothetical protein